MEFISSEKLYSRINTLLHSYGEAGLLDEDDYYDWTKSILLRLNIPAFNDKETILSVIGGKASLPEDFYQLWAVWNTTPCKNQVEGRKEFQSSYAFYQQDIHYHKDKVDCKTVITPTEENIVRRNVYFQDNTEVSDDWKDVKLMQLKKHNSELCHSQCPNKKVKSNLQFTINEKQIVTNFSDGYIILQYDGFEKDEYNLPMIPNIVQIEDAIEAFIVYKAFQKLYYNNTADVLQRMQYAEIQYVQKYKEALSYVNLPSFSTMVEMAKKNKNRWSKFYPNESRPSVKTNWWYNPRY